MTLPQLILRFADTEKDTIVEHRAMIQRDGFVWWGWWKKVFEAKPPDGLLPVGRTDPFEVGLFRRKPEEAFFLATCTGVAYFGGESTDCPSRRNCPEYYHDDSFPAWFRFSNIQDLSRSEWIARFGEVPEADNTFYWIDPNAGLLPELEPAVATSTPASGILHVSDLHYGKFHAFGPGWGDGVSMVDRLLETVAATGVKIGVVVASGDFISAYADVRETFETARDELRKLLEGLELRAEHLVIVPGNHDIPLEQAMEKGTRTYEFEAQYRLFMNEMRGSDVEEIESLTRFDTEDGRVRLSFIGLNSVRLRDEETREYGYVGHRSGPWFRRLKAQEPPLGERSHVRFVVVHHHLLPAAQAPRATPVSVMVDAARIVEDCQSSGVDVALHGHQHFPFMATVSRVVKDGEGSTTRLPRPLTVIGAGSSGSKDLTADLPLNSCGIYEPGDERLRVVVQQFNPAQAPTPYLEATLPLSGR
jgi:predicted MPP superfamily phosphohydrolase